MIDIYGGGHRDYPIACAWSRRDQSKRRDNSEFKTEKTLMGCFYARQINPRSIAADNPMDVFETPYIQEFYETQDDISSMRRGDCVKTTEREWIVVQIERRVKVQKQYFNQRNPSSVYIITLRGDANEPKGQR